MRTRDAKQQLLERAKQIGLNEGCPICIRYAYQAYTGRHYINYDSLEKHLSTHK